MQSSRELLPAALVLPVGQLVQETVPGDAANDPGSHFSQVGEPKADATIPGSHLVQPEDPADANLPCVQSMHVEMDVAPSTAETVPPAQAVLFVEPPRQ